MATKAGATNRSRPSLYLLRCPQRHTGNPAPGCEPNGDGIHITKGLSVSITGYQPPLDFTSAGISPTVPLRPYQEEARQEVLAAQRRGLRRIAVQMPTGAGKTVLFAHLVGSVCANGGRALILAHRDELIAQAADKLGHVLGGDAPGIGIVKAELDNVSAQIVVASVQTLARDQRLQRVMPDFALVVVDECHHASADTYVRVLEHCRCFDDDGPLLVGVTATLDRGDGVGLDEIFEEIVYECSMLDLMQQGYLVDLKAKQIQIEADFASLRVQHGDISDGDSAKMLIDAEAPAHIAQAYREHASDRKGIVFTPTVAVAHAAADALLDVGIGASALDATTPKETRRQMLRDLKSGAVQVVANCGVLTEGFDEPSVSCITIARPTRSRALYTQMAGRGTRPYPGKSDCLILDTVGVTNRHDLVTVASLFGLPLSSLKKQSVNEATAELMEAQARSPLLDATSGTVVARNVDLFRRRPSNWIPTKTGRFVLVTGTGAVALQASQTSLGEDWDVIHQEKGKPPVIIASGMEMGYAQGLAEDFVRDLGAGALVNPNASWRLREPSEKQIKMARYCGIPSVLLEGKTSGQVSDLIAAAQAADLT